MAHIAELMEELDRFYGATQAAPLPDRVSQIETNLFGTAAAASVLLAREAGLVLGFASYSYLWPAVGLTRSLYLKELYVRQASQRHGVGTALMQAVCDIAAKSGCSRVEWTTERTNAAALAFYAQLDAPMNPVKVFYRLDNDAVNRLARTYVP